MSDYLSKPCTAFTGTRKLAGGALIDVALAVKEVDPAMVGDAVLVFDDATGGVVDLDLRGSTADIVARLTIQGKAVAHAGKARRQPTGDVSHTGRGRPKLGVVAREVTLLPRHWEWLAAQPGGASQMLRRLVDQARRSDGGQTGIRDARERTYRFLSALAGNLPGFEEATRALFSGDDSAFAGHMRDWPADVKAHALMLARPLPAQKTGS